MNKVFIIMETFDPYDLQWGVRTSSNIVGVYSTIEKAMEAFEDCKKHVINTEEDKSDYYAYGDYIDPNDEDNYHNDEHVSYQIITKIIDL